jgi:hypothetical protein
MVRIKSWFILCTISVSILITSCVQPSPTPNPFIEVYPIIQYQADAFGFAMFWEDFEDGDYTSGVNWQIESSNVTYNRRLVYEAYSNDHFLLLDGPQDGEQGHGTGFSTLPSVDSILIMDPNNNGYQPNKVSFNIFTWYNPGNTAGAFVLKGHHPVDDSEVKAIEFFADKHGRFNVNGISYGQIDENWHLIEFRQINWEDYPNIPVQFNLFIDNSLVGECVPFLNPVKGFYKIEVYNYHRGHTGYDNIMMINEADTEGINYCGPEDYEGPPVPPPPPPPEPGDPSAFIATAKGDAACRQGPANEYPEVDYVEEGFSAPVLGRNDDSNWFVVTGSNWGEECWIWEGLLETTGDINPVPVLPDPPLVLPDSDGGSGDGPEEGPSACLVQQMNGSTKCISPCPLNAHPGTPCTP